ncbi:hypothetical protein DVK85_01230 [Flavobacterium arcticum]|uniref:Uncharacterized protein n=1 Tax=Flavobacterium arcticum TaxID=1784713 RepID=A0A345H8L5_9FLAO|nr:hypothetical protein [Flavobacterium arcticum]AXG72925.1 hypothetical protein DVK85_01230 [Flavobacterium arcticum]KAF2510410.1 hypothetical protein E0W72_07975 [Flavobacterium arcticum]
MSIFEFSRLLGQLSPVFLILGVLLGMLLYKRLNAIHKSIIYYFLAMLCVDLTGRFLAQYGNNHVVLIVYSLVEVMGVGYFYYKFLLSKRYVPIFIVNILAILYISWELFSYLFFKTDVKYFQPYAKVVDNFVVILLALTFLYEKMNDFKESRWDNFKLNIVVLVFFTLNTLIFLPFNFLVNESTGIKFYFWMGNLLIVLLFYGFLINEVWKNGRQSKLTPQ